MSSTQSRKHLKILNIVNLKKQKMKASHFAQSEATNDMPGLAWYLHLGKNPLKHRRSIVLIPVSGRSSGGENGNSLQYACLGNPTDRGNL